MKKLVKLQLVGIDGNAFVIMGRFRRAARSQKWTEAETKEVLDDAMSGDYDHLLQTIMKWCEDPEDEE